jgi:hypothetical protein
VSRAGQTSKSKGPRARKAFAAVEQLQASQKSFQNFSKILSYLEQGALRSSVAEGTLKRGDFPFEGGASSTNSAYIGWLKGRFNHQSHDVTLWQRLRQLLERSYVAL